MESRDSGRYLVFIRHLISAPFRAALELIGLFSPSQASLLTSDSLAHRAHRRRTLLAGLPSILVLIALLALLGWGATSRSRLNNHYAEKLSEAVAESNPTNAQKFSQRVFQPGIRNLPTAAMDYCSYLASQKDLLQATSIIEKIAPDDAPGFPPAHAQRAIAFSNLLSQGASDRYLPILLWHLKQAGDPTTENLWIAWANYFRLTGQIERTVQALESAANLNPTHWLSVADLYVLDGKPELARRALANASNAYRMRLGKYPLASQDRLQLAIAQARMGEYQQAAETLHAGLELSPQNEELLRGQTQLEIIGLEQSLKLATKLPQKLDIVRELLKKSADPSGIYQATVELYQQASTTEEKGLVWEILDECLKLYGPNPALMFSQSVILVNQGKISEAMQKLQTTIDSFPEHGLSLNNLAWLLATQDPQDLERARSYAQRAIATNPKMATFHDTLGTILLELNDWRSAIAELELALSQTPIQKRSKIHAKLARAYESIGDRTLATLHRERSDQIP